jgi:hypothetical protein
MINPYSVYQHVLPCDVTFMFVTLTFMFDLFDLLFKSFHMGVAVSGICLSRGHLFSKGVVNTYNVFCLPFVS